MTPCLLPLFSCKCTAQLKVCSKNWEALGFGSDGTLTNKKKFKYLNLQPQVAATRSVCSSHMILTRVMNHDSRLDSAKPKKDSQLCERHVCTVGYCNGCSLNALFSFENSEVDLLKIALKCIKTQGILSMCTHPK